LCCEPPLDTADKRKLDGFKYERRPKEEQKKTQQKSKKKKREKPSKLLLRLLRSLTRPGRASHCRRRRRCWLQFSFNWSASSRDARLCLFFFSFPFSLSLGALSF
jgi:hypothetical protein